METKIKIKIKIEIEIEIKIEIVTHLSTSNEPFFIRPIDLCVVKFKQLFNQIQDLLG